MNRRSFLLAMLGSQGLMRSALAEESRAAQRGSKGAGNGDSVSFAPVVPGRRLVFPDDYGAHPDFRTEWWYVTGWLRLPDGTSIGFQSTFFRVRTGIGEDNPSAFAPRQLILAHAAIADPRLGRLRHDERIARAAFDRAGFTRGRTHVWIGDWVFEQTGDGYRVLIPRSESGGFAYELQFSTPDAPLLNGAGGFSAKAPDPRHASYYYSRPQLKVAGTVTLDGRALPVTGLAWLDHEWSSELLPSEAQGWDWTGINFDDGGALMAFRLRRQDGGPLWHAGTLRNGNQGNSDIHVLTNNDLTFTPTREWASSRTGIRYPVQWQVRAGARTFDLAPLFDDQELDSRRSTGNVYWEGAVRAQETGRTVGKGYLELTGYDRRIRIG